MLNTKAFFAVSALAIILSGCTTKVKSPAYSAVTPEAEVRSLDFKECERELQALREVDNDKFSILEKQFENIMSGSASYANVRNTVNRDTQDTIDTLYHYQSAKVCHDIRVAMLESLVEQAGAAK